MTDEAPVQADARSVIDWYRSRLAAAQHDLAFAQCALAAEQEQAALLRGELGQMRTEIDALLAQAEGATGQPPPPDDDGFEAWVVEHWPQIEDARLAHMLRHADQPASAVQP